MISGKWVRGEGKTALISSEMMLLLEDTLIKSSRFVQVFHEFHDTFTELIVVLTWNPLQYWELQLTSDATAWLVMESPDVKVQEFDEIVTLCGYVYVRFFSPGDEVLFDRTPATVVCDWGAQNEDSNDTVRIRMVDDDTDITVRRQRLTKR
ncbi:hypothetical protein CO180_04085 [candidate division WWE3 bacterium CG_4_9_14_3_um_filter_41_6]|uniref:Uncharacterized protein n=1 Tax=candidate division WWE3 bacterium CG_4_10_14_0_2_um_filter_41_14 TaxID=1975072 RepID=A0A2M7TKZ6_UNCKA|nr:MAG: hypothetical protein COY32_01540 [candidate division WWE3 bacterium CG_4_10_14_0_2_um_filter_41_14]PJA38207.1 MAG: hypothetical protein CO180_04085 [candidate division WWE3 bacterium CG_4_9_14_3_um_filter_41_6]